MAVFLWRSALGRRELLVGLLAGRRRGADDDFAVFGYVHRQALFVESADLAADGFVNALADRVAPLLQERRVNPIHRSQTLGFV